MWEDPSRAEEILDGGGVFGGDGPIGFVAKRLVEESEFLAAGSAVKSGEEGGLSMGGKKRVRDRGKLGRGKCLVGEGG